MVAPESFGNQTISGFTSPTAHTPPNT